MDLNTSDSLQFCDPNSAVLDAMPGAIIALTADWKLAYLNQHAQGLFGAHHGRHVGQDFWRIDSGLESSDFEVACRRAMHERLTAKATVRHGAKDRWYEATATYVAPSLLVYFHDVTAQLMATQALRESRLHFQVLADSIPQMVWIVEASGTAVYFNRQWRAYTGVAVDATTPADVTAEFVHPEDREPTLQAWRTAYEQGTAFHVEHRIRSAGGDYRWFLVLAEPYRNSAGTIERWFGTSTDVHEQKMAEIALIESELRFRALVTATSDVVYRMSPDWKFMHRSMDAVF